MSRAQSIGDAAIALLAAQGMHGLTHRNIDREIGAPKGTTSNYARTRTALVRMALSRMAELESDELSEVVMAPQPATAAELAEMAAQAIYFSITNARERMLARYELAMETARNPELKSSYDSAGDSFRKAAVEFLRQSGADEPNRRARILIAWSEGVMFDSLAGSGQTQPPTLDELRKSASELFSTLITGPAVAPPPGPSGNP